MKLLAITALAFGCALTVRAADRFNRIKQELKEAQCVQFEFLSILESDIFDTVDTARGLAYIAGDGRFWLRLGDEIYINDGHERYSYVPDNEQVVIEPADPSDSRQISFLTRIDQYYKTSPVEAGRRYQLDLLDSTATEMPERVTIWILPDTDRIDRLEYRDINDELNRFVVTGQVVDSVCDESRFVPDFDESIERVRIP